MIRAAAVTALVALAACASPRYGMSPDGPRQGTVMLCVANRSEGVGTIRVWVDDFRTHTVASGRRECRQIRDTAAGSRLYAESIGGGFGGPVQYQGELVGGGVNCWDWVLRDSRASQIRLVPCAGS